MGYERCVLTQDIVSTSGCAQDVLLLHVWAAPRGGRARLPAARPARPRRRALRLALALASGGAGLASGLSAVVLAAARRCRSAFLRLCGRLPRGRRLPAARALPSSGALARRSLAGGFPPALARCGAPVLALRAPPVRCGLRAGPLAPAALRLLGARARSGRGLPAAGLALSFGASVAAPPAGALGPLRGPRGAAFRAPAGRGFGALRRAALLRRAGNLPASSSQENASWGLTSCIIRGTICSRMV